MYVIMEGKSTWTPPWKHTRKIDISDTATLLRQSKSLKRVKLNLECKYVVAAGSMTAIGNCHDEVEKRLEETRYNFFHF